jgi:microcystin-dependent protein
MTLALDLSTILNGAANDANPVKAAFLAIQSFVNTLMPVGVVTPFAGSSAPSGWLICDGSQVSQTTYASLYAAIGANTFAPDAGGNFTLPDLRGRVPVGVDGAAGRLSANDALAQSGGAERVTLTAAESGVNGSGTTGNPAGWGQLKYRRWQLEASVAVGSGGDPVAPGASPHADAPLDVEGSQNHGHPLNARDADTAHNNMQPYQVLNYIIKAS